MTFTETLRPNNLEEVVGQSHIVSRLIYIVKCIHEKDETDDIPHFLFCGQAGVGKTSTAIAYMKSAFGDSWSSNWLELNASDERSISVIRNKVKDFAKRGVIGSYEVNGEIRPVPFNVVFLDECDNLTPDAQASLRRMMERYSQTKFILSANYPHKLIDPIKDRCAFSESRFKPIPKDEMKEALSRIENCSQLTDDALDLLILTANGSMRKALNLLWSITRVPMQIDRDDVLDFVSTIQPVQVKKLLARVLKAQKSDNETSLRLYRDIDNEIDNLNSLGLSGIDILNAVYSLVADDDTMPLALRQIILKNMGDGLHWASICQDDILAVKSFMRRLSFE